MREAIFESRLQLGQTFLRFIIARVVAGSWRPFENMEAILTNLDHPLERRAAPNALKANTWHGAKSGARGAHLDVFAGELVKIN